MSEPRSTRSAVGGFPGFRRLNQFYDMWLEGARGQTEAVGEFWDHLRSKDNYSFGDWGRDVARLWERSFAMMEDMWLFPVRATQKERPGWISLVWSRTTRQDTIQDEIDLDRPVASDQDPLCTAMERLGHDIDPDIQNALVKPTLNDARNRLTVCIKGLGGLSPALQAGHFVGFVYTKNASQPLAIVFLTVTDS